MRKIWISIVAVLIGNVISNLTYRRLDFFQYNTGIDFYALENIIKSISNYALTVMIALSIYGLISIFVKKLKAKKKALP
ncbi:hypothetical protein [Paenibacillus macquariensis]|uniref:Uncharacterized protein n=2 Tax=Paenibacillus macquariensis TaxID=948756 RepID=A0ABY1KDE2_9BACL|nr:hypothetical protein [Paenibacillus macquariensis]MEC0091929.1 hypothetical protein [Paenibacillus macquariensis]OAB24976.1 hypothetical protein PMSM_28485 [Paenibacillus macquariensis subsp. macquariensis]SIR65074.1 hypothetical protein SAMN05421578_12710 [Paenibacillus macquariensis]